MVKILPESLEGVDEGAEAVAVVDLEEAQEMGVALDPGIALGEEIPQDDELGVQEQAVSIVPTVIGNDIFIKLTNQQVLTYPEEGRDSITSLEVTEDVEEVTFDFLKRFNNLKCLKMSFDAALFELPSLSLRHLNLTFKRILAPIDMLQIIQSHALEFVHMSFMEGAFINYRLALNELSLIYNSPALKTLFITLDDARFITEHGLLDLIFCHFFNKNMALTFTNITPATVGDRKFLSYETVQMLSSLVNLEFLFLKGIWLYESEILKDGLEEHKYRHLVHLFLDTCNPMAKLEFDWMITRMPVLHFLRLRNIKVNVDDFAEYMKNHESLVQISFYTDIYVPSDYTIDKVVLLLAAAKPERVQKLCLCDYYLMPTSRESEDPSQLGMVFEGNLCCAAWDTYPRVENVDCVLNCDAYCRADLNCHAEF